MIKIQSSKSHITHDLTCKNDINYLLTMNGEHNKEEDIDETNLRSSSNSTTSNISCRSSSLCTTSVLRKQQQINRRRAFFNDDVTVTNNNNNNHSLTIDDNQQIQHPTNDHDGIINEENIPTLTNNNEENQTNKPFKRKVVSFSTMPCEKKVADGKYTETCFFFRFFL
jgi:arylamine N-acetyltransferase